MTLGSTVNMAAENGDDPGGGACPRDFKGANGGMRVRRAHDCRVQFARNDDIGDEASAPAQQPHIFDAPDRGADPFRRGLYRGVYCSSSRRRSSRS